MWDSVLSKTRSVVQGDISYIAQEGWERFKQITETYANGSTRVRYVNESGDDVTDKVQRMQRAGHHFMKTRKGQAG
jgi:hypothetical protein